MAIINAINPIDINKELNRLELFKDHPSAMVEIGLNLQADITNGRVTMIDPNTPPAYIISNMALFTSFHIQQHLIGLKSLYPKLANNEKDLYKHMSDYDYVGVYSTPSFADVSFNVPINEFGTKAYLDPTNGDRVMIIPRYTSVTIDNYCYTLPASIIIRITESGIPDVRFDKNVTDDLFPLSTDFIVFREIRLNQSEAYLNFTVRLPEVSVRSSEIMIKRGGTVRSSIDYDKTRKFYYVKAFRIDVNTGKWIPMLTTHTEDVYDINEPTCIVNVNRKTGSIDYYVPPIYVNNKLIEDKVKLVVYTSRGEINVNFSDYLIDDFELKYNEIFPSEETNEFTRPLKMIGVKTYIEGTVIGGTNGKTFSQLKYDVINNNLRPHLPITNVNISNLLRNTGLEPVKNYDVVTSRESLVKLKIPSSVSRYKVSKASLDLIELKTSIKELTTNKNGVISIDKDKTIIPRGTIFEVVRGSGLKILTKEDHKRLTSLSGQRLAIEVNNKDYMSSYYHYILDDVDGTTEFRAYDLQKPKVNSTSFVDYNNTTMLSVNTLSSMITKINSGYRIDILVTDRTFNERYDINNVVPVLAILDSGNRFFLEGKLYSNTVQGKVFSFYIETQGYIDRRNRLLVDNFKDVNGSKLRIGVDIEADLELLWCTNSTPVTFVSSNMDKLLRNTYMANTLSVITRERHSVSFAKHMKYLYTRLYTSTGKGEYRTYQTDVYDRYKTTVFGPDNKVKHKPGDYVLDEDGNKVIKFKQGDVVFDGNNEPVIIGNEDLARYFNLLLLDYKFTLANSELTEEYKGDIDTYIDTILLRNMEDINKQLLEATEAYATVPNGLIDVNVFYNGKVGYIKPNQKFKLDVYVSYKISKDEEVKKYIRLAITEILDKYLSGRRILKRDDIEQLIRNKLSEFINSVALVGMTELNANYIEVLNDNGEVSIAKNLIVTPDGYDVVDAVDVNFISQKRNQG